MGLKTTSLATVGQAKDKQHCTVLIFVDLQKLFVLKRKSIYMFGKASNNNFFTYNYLLRIVYHISQYAFFLEKTVAISAPLVI